MPRSALVFNRQYFKVQVQHHLFIRLSGYPLTNGSVIILVKYVNKINSEVTLIITVKLLIF